MSITLLPQAKQLPYFHLMTHCNMTEQWQDMMDFFCTTWSPCHNSIFCSALTLCTMGPHCTRAQKHTHPRSLLSAVQNVLFLYDVAKNIWNDIHIAMATVGGSFETGLILFFKFQGDICSLSSEVWSHRHARYYQVYLASHIRICLFLVCTSGQQRKNILTKECSLYSAVFFLTSIYRST